MQLNTNKQTSIIKTNLLKYLLVYLLLSLFIISCDGIFGGSNDNKKPPKPIKSEDIFFQTPKENNYYDNKKVKTGCEEAILPGCKPL